MKLVPRRNTLSNNLGYRGDVDDIFNRFFNDWPFSSIDTRQKGNDFFPQVNITETERAYKVSAELPGLEEKDFEIFIEDNLLILKGEKKEEHREEGENIHSFESTYGSFQRTFRLPDGVDTEKTEAKFKNGVLTLKLNKDSEKQKRKRITLD